MSKKFKSQRCAYCAEREAVTGDHIFAREFFLPSARANLPQAPICEQCNNEKSKLEHYLTTVLPFGGRHSASPKTLPRWCQNDFVRTPNCIVSLRLDSRVSQLLIRAARSYKPSPSLSTVTGWSGFLP